MTYPIAEIFHSIQGEGFWTGTPMMFVRLAGCNVGKYEQEFVRLLPPDSGASSIDERMAYPQHSVCTSFDGQRFLCDTDYHTKEHLTAEQIASQVKLEEHVCITGGEPFLHDLKSLIAALNTLTDEHEIQVIHIETSGTKPLDRSLPVWITLCPKEGVLEDAWDKADEIKILVGPDFSEADLIKITGKVQMQDNLYLQPINGVHEVWQENLNHCLALLEWWPNWKLSAQLHKYLSVR